MYIKAKWDKRHLVAKDKYALWCIEKDKERAQSRRKARQLSQSASQRQLNADMSLSPGQYDEPRTAEQLEQWKKRVPVVPKEWIERKDEEMRVRLERKREERREERLRKEEEDKEKKEEAERGFKIWVERKQEESRRKR